VRVVTVVVDRGEDGKLEVTREGSASHHVIEHRHQRHSNSITRRDTLSYSPATEQLTN